MSRYALKGRRPGESYYTPHGRIQTHPVDGGAALTEEQRAYFEKDGQEVVRVDDTAPSAQIDIQQQVQDQAADTAYHEAVAAGAAAGEYGQAPKTLKTFHDIARGQHATSGADLAAHAKSGDELVPKNARRTLGDPVIVPPTAGKAAKAPVTDPPPSADSKTNVDDGAGKSDLPAV